MTTVILSDTYQLLLSGSGGVHVFSQETFKELDFPCKITWDARGCKDTEKIKDKLESCCLLVSIDILDITHDLEQWLSETFKEKSVFHLVGTNAISYPNMQIERTVAERKEIVVSNVCWFPFKDKEMWTYLRSVGVTNLNISLSMYRTVNVHFVRDLKQRLDNAGLKVFSVNSIFYGRKENVFSDYYTYVQHFKKMLHFAKILGAQCVIYGSANSRYVHSSIIHEYDSYKRAHDMFLKTMQEIADIAKELDLLIYIKPNVKKVGCNYLFDESQVNDMVSAIDHSHIKTAPMRSRSGYLNSFDTFNLIEFQPDLVIEGLQEYLSNLFSFL